MKLILQAIKSLLNKINIRLAELDIIKSRLTQLDNKIVPSDWRAAEGEPGHVLHRTHWIEYEDKELLPTTQCHHSSSQGFHFIPGTIPVLTVGKTYEVTYNGVKYTTTAFELPPIEILGGAEGLVGLGNPAVLGLGNNNQPFLAAIFPPGAQNLLCGFIAALDEATSVTVSIFGPAEVIHPLPAKFLSAKGTVIVKGAENDDGYVTTDMNFSEVFEQLAIGNTAQLVVNGRSDVVQGDFYPVEHFNPDWVTFSRISLDSTGKPIYTRLILRAGTSGGQLETREFS